MRLLRFLLLTVVVLPGSVVIGGSGPAFACSCAYQDVPDAVVGADEIFAGTLVRMEDPPQRAVMSSSDPITYTVAVDSVYRGDLGMSTTFESPMSGASCGLEGMLVDRRYLVFLSTDGPRRTASLCDGTALATPKRINAVERLTGAPAHPAYEAKGATAAGEAPAARDGESPVADTSTWVVSVAGVAALVGMWLQWRRRATHRQAAEL